MFVIGVANHKGGTGKTATAHNLGAILADCGKRVLLIDADAQGSLTAACGVNGDADGQSLVEVMGGARPGASSIRDVRREITPGLDLVPSHIGLAGSEAALHARIGKELVLKRALEMVADEYDVALIDCPPSLGVMTVNALVAADAVLIPTQPTGQDLRGLRLFMDTVGEVKDVLNPNLRTTWILVTFFDGRFRHHQDAVTAMEGADWPVLPIKIGRTVRIAEASTLGQTIMEYEPGNPQAQNYNRLGVGIDAWLTNKLAAH